MSAIAGTYDLAAGPSAAAHPDAQHQQRHRVLAMLGAMPHRATDGAHAHSSGLTTLGHALRRTLPEDQLLPLSGDAATSADHLLLTAHVRIDNREALTQHLGLDPAQTRTWPDARFILAAYQRWGTACADHLRGAFAFALWDAREHHLFLGRDPFGLLPLYYHHDPSRQRFAFASEIKALLTLPEVPRHLNETRLAEYLVRLPGDGRSTIYQDIYRLEPGHAMLVRPGPGSGGELRTWRYFTLEADASVGQNWSDARYAEAFAEHFAEAVRVRLRSAGPVGSELSGGLDSSYVTFEAARQLAEQGKSLSTFSLVFDAVPQSDERSYMEVALEALQARGWPVEPHFVAGDAVGPLSNLDDVYAVLDDGVVSDNQQLGWEVLKVAQQAGIRVLLDGADGDATVSHGALYLDELAQQGNWTVLKQEMHAAQQRHANIQGQQLQQLLGSYYDMTYRFGVRQLDQAAQQQHYRQTWSVARALHRHFGLPWSMLLRRVARPLLLRQKTRSSEPGLSVPAVVNADAVRPLLGEALARDAAAASADEPLTVRGNQRHRLQSMIEGLSFEVGEQRAMWFGIDARHPFMDEALIAYCLALPPQQSFTNGWTRWVMRRAMQQATLPDPITWRVDKATLAPVWKYGLLRHDHARLCQALYNPGALAPWVHQSALRAAVDRAPSQSIYEQEPLARLVSVKCLIDKCLTDEVESARSSSPASPSSLPSPSAPAS